MTKKLKTMKPMKVKLPKTISVGKIVPRNYFEKVIVRFFRFKVVIKKIPNPIIDAVKKETSLLYSIPRCKPKKQIYEIT